MVKMKIELNNQRYMLVNIDKHMNIINISIFDNKNNLESKRTINEFEFVDLFNILTYAQNHKKDIFRLWEAK